jgi:hypothetical protein
MANTTTAREKVITSTNGRIDRENRKFQPKTEGFIYLVKHHPIATPVSDPENMAAATSAAASNPAETASTTGDAPSTSSVLNSLRLSHTYCALVDTSPRIEIKKTIQRILSVTRNVRLNRSCTSFKSSA